MVVEVWYMVHKIKARVRQGNSFVCDVA